MRWTALILTTLTGFAGLVYEVTWQRYLATLLGSHSEATAAVLGIFLGGLSLGYALFGRITARVLDGTGPARAARRILLLYGGVELAIGVYAVLFPGLFSVAQLATGGLPSNPAILAFACDVLLAAALIGPPSVLMGATVPMLTQALSHRLADATRVHALVYGTNTVGAFAGALAAGFWLLPTLGLVGVLQGASVINGVAGVIFIAMSRRATATQESPPTPTARSGGGDSLADVRWHLLAAFLIGFAMMALQTTLIRVAGLALGSSHFTFSMVVAVFVLCIAMGSFAVAPFRSIASYALVANLWLLALLLIGLYFFLEDSPYWVHRLRSLFRHDPNAFGVYHALVFCGILATVGPAAILSGSLLPLIFHRLRQQFGELGRVAGAVYSWNTIGSLTGALVGGYLLLFWLDLHQIYRLGVAAVAVAAAGLTAQLPGTGRAPAAALLGIAGLAGALLLEPWAVDRMVAGLFRSRDARPATHSGPDAFFAEWFAENEVAYPFYDDDPALTVAVRRFDLPSGQASLSIIVNGKPDGALTVEYPTMALLGLLPAAMAATPEQSFVIGFGTGITVGELAALEQMRSVTVAEISPAVVAAAPLFEKGNLGAGTHEKVRLVRSDAFRAFLSTRETYDVIVSEPSNPWVSGVEMLYSREFLSAARSRMNPGGVFAQWFHTYETDTKTVELVLRTFASVFPDCAVWFGMGTDLILLGFKEPGEAWLDRFVSRIQQPDYAAGFGRAELPDVFALAAHELIPRGVIAHLELSGPLHTLLHPLLSDSAARAFFVGGVGALPRGPRLEAARAGVANSMLQGLLAARGSPLTPEERRSFVLETCFHRREECLTLLAQWRNLEPDDPILHQAIGLARRRPQLAEGLTEAALGDLEVLFDPPPELPRTVDPQAFARAATDHFEHFYHFAAPFSRAALRHIWELCEARPDLAAGCARDRARVAKRLGDLSVEVQPAVRSTREAASEPN